MEQKTLLELAFTAFKNGAR